MDRVELLRYITRHFSMDDLQQTCMELHVDIEDLPGGSLQEKARNLIIYLEKRNRLAEIEPYCQPKQAEKAPPTAKPKAPPIPSPPTEQPAKPKLLNPVIVTQLLQTFFERAEINQLAERLGVDNGRLQSPSAENAPKLVTTLDKQDQLQALVDAAQSQRPDLPWAQCHVPPGLLSTSPTRPIDAVAITKLCNAAFNNLAAAQSFCRENAPDFLAIAAPNLSKTAFIREMTLYLHRRQRLEALLETLKTNYPTQYSQHAPYDRAERPVEKRQRELARQRMLKNQANEVLTPLLTQWEKQPPPGIKQPQTITIEAAAPLQSLAWTADGEHLFCVLDNGTVGTWNGRSGTLNTQFRTAAKKPPSFATLMPSGAEALLITGPVGKQALQIYQLAAGKLIVDIPGVPPHAKQAAISPDGTWAMSAGSGNTLQRWDLVKAFAQETWPGHQQKATSVLIMPDGRRVISAGRDETIRIWNDAGEELHVIKRVKRPFTHLTISPDGRYLAALPQHTNTIFVWQIPPLRKRFLGRLVSNPPQQVAQLSEHQGVITALSFSANGRFLASRADDNTIRLWRSSDWQPHAKLITTPVSGLAFHPTKPLLASSHPGSRAIRLWEIG